MTKIIDKMDDIHLAIYKDPEGAGGDLAEKLQELAFPAVVEGLGSPEWEKYMSEFVSTPAQLARLMGNEEVFNNNSWAKQTLAYIVANSTCGIETTTGTRKNLTPEMIFSLDDGIG